MMNVPQYLHGYDFYTDCVSQIKWFNLY